MPLTTSFHVVLVDDTKFNLALFNGILAKIPNIQTYAFLDPVEGLAHSLTHAPDLVLVDLMMPGMSGLEFLERFRAQYPHTPVVMITASLDATHRRTALELGANDFLTKPVEQFELVARVKTMLAMRQAMRNAEARSQTLAAQVELATKDLRAQERVALMCLSKAAEYRDPETGAHIERMAHYSEVIARQMALPSAECELILTAAPMHDIGKVGTPDAILLKPGKLTDDEFNIMKQHTTIGHAVLSSAPSALMDAAATIAISHHEKFDGSGYPYGLAGEDIPLHGRIVAVADVFDALTSERPYKKAWPLEKALDLINASAGSHFDPACVAAFNAGLPEILSIRETYQDAD